MVSFAHMLALGLGFLKAAAALNPVVDLGYAKYQGRQLGNGVNQYLGMRYAQPPVGDLRFRAPTSPLHEQAVQNASAFGPTCFATDNGNATFADEDCLRVNVWAPAGAANLPVMVFIQGGGYTANSGTTYNGSQIVEVSGRNIVYVTFGYRVGLFGFLAGKQVRRDGDLNAGLLDQRFLLQWVQNHISQFGGNPKHVVIQGASAGAGSVNLHLTSYGGRNDGYFAGAIAESTFMPWQPRVWEVEWQYDATITAAGCQSASDQMKCLRGLGRDALQKLNVGRPYPGHAIKPKFYWTPVLDGDMISGNPYDLFDSGKFIKVPLLYGTCTNEGTDFAANIANQSDIAPWMAANYPHLTRFDTDLITRQYPLMAPLAQHQAWFPSLAAAYGEATFICPTQSFLNSITSTLRSSSSSAAAPSASQVWSYRFDVHDASFTAKGLGVPHVFEVPAVFGPLQLPLPNPYQSFETYNAGVVTAVQGYWTSFARALDPNRYRAEKTPEWLPWEGTNGGRRLLFQTGGAKMEDVGEEERGRCEFWKGIRRDMEQ